MHSNLLATLVLGTLSGINAQAGRRGSCLFPRAIGFPGSYIISLKEGINQDELASVISKLINEIRCQGGTVKNPFDFGSYNAILASFPSNLRTSLNSPQGPFAKYIANIEADQVMNILSVDS
ncbi:hypothetical protein DSO57_1011435 [Entomophthora muscae]|uniref:Uncharacterized protein n=1 Tax=Entomophthora muscae TaxID=34485 RepID=A0ACC2UTC1_9FUNG|nr:hypothetical protein DSO57_1011435 [Entomophthora muscae]